MKIAFSITLLLLTISSHPQTQGSFTVHFDFNEYSLTSKARSQLDSFLIAEKQDLGNLGIELNGYCDAIGSDGYNNRLSNQRVSAVKKYLLKNGIDEINIGDEIGHGKKIPLNNNRTEEERWLNRRVEISFFTVVQTSLPVPKELKEIIADSAITSGSTIVLRNINFVGGMHLFLPGSQPMLDELLGAMRAYPKLVIRIEGHICCIADAGDGPDGETGRNDLSLQRAKAVHDYLLSNGIEASRISYKGFGHSVPLYPYPEKTEEERVSNRRVEIKIISK